MSQHKSNERDSSEAQSNNHHPKDVTDTNEEFHSELSKKPTGKK